MYGTRTVQLMQLSVCIPIIVYSYYNTVHNIYSLYSIQTLGKSMGTEKKCNIQVSKSESKESESCI